MENTQVFPDAGEIDLGKRGRAEQNAKNHKGPKTQWDTDQHSGRILCHLQSRLVRLAEAIAGVSDCKCSVLLRRDLDPVCRAVMYRSGRSIRSRLRRRNRSDRHGCGPFINSIRDKKSWHGVLLPAQLREVKLPEI